MLGKFERATKGEGVEFFIIAVGIAIAIAILIRETGASSSISARPESANRPDPPPRFLHGLV